MDTAFQISKFASILAFLAYGGAVLFTDAMEAEFRRFGLSRMRRLTGVLEVVGALGLAAGAFVPALVVPAATGLAMLMFLGVLTRVRVGDPWAASVPAAVLLVLNAFVALHAALA